MQRHLLKASELIALIAEMNKGNTKFVGTIEGDKLRELLIVTSTGAFKFLQTEYSANFYRIEKDPEPERHLVTYKLLDTKHTKECEDEHEAREFLRKIEDNDLVEEAQYVHKGGSTDSKELQLTANEIPF